LSPYFVSFFAFAAEIHLSPDRLAGAGPYAPTPDPFRVAMIVLALANSWISLINTDRLEVLVVIPKQRFMFQRRTVPTTDRRR
jgi:hypothetical protein